MHSGRQLHWPLVTGHRAFDGVNDDERSVCVHGVSSTGAHWYQHCEVILALRVKRLYRQETSEEECEILGDLA